MEGVSNLTRLIWLIGKEGDERASVRPLITKYKVVGRLGALFRISFYYTNCPLCDPASIRERYKRIRNYIFFVGRV